MTNSSQKISYPKDLIHGGVLEGDSIGLCIDYPDAHGAQKNLVLVIFKENKDLVLDILMIKNKWENIERT